MPLPPDDPEQTEISNAAAEKIRDAMDAMDFLTKARGDGNLASQSESDGNPDRTKAQVWSVF
ncbi:MAG: hypothetical protein EBW74_11270 [Betaproteobacteria bacterium]|nr:hypothetical protein [Betaproteobacteria bacterium]